MKSSLILTCCCLFVACSSGSVETAAPGPQGGTPGGVTPGGCFDRDMDGYQSGTCNPSPNGVPRGGDCDDYSNAKSPGNREDCSNSVDNDCDGLVGAQDPDCMKECEDADNDGYQSALCNSDPRARGNDCDDNNPMINPGRPEQCGNMLDDDCKGGDLPCLANCEDRDRDGFGVGSGCYGPDCNDGDANVNPWATDVCTNNIDEDCDGQITQCRTDCIDRDGDGYGNGGSNCLGFDCNDEDARIHPGARELPGDNVDQDCNGSDLARGIACMGDRDGDGYGPNGVAPCLGLDCDEGDPRIHQGRVDGCDNGVDEDCSGADNICNPMMSACPGGGAPTIEICNGLDDDCDSRTDECARRGHECFDGNCVGTAGAPCASDNECAASLNLYCNLNLRECRVKDGEGCQSSGDCNPTASCEVGLCSSDQRCYQALSGPCEDSCDCASTYTCLNNSCVQCQSDFDCNRDQTRPLCSTGGFCVADVNFNFTPGDICENTCGEDMRDEDETPWINDGECDELGHPNNMSGAACDPGSDCGDCGVCVGCDSESSSTTMEDTLGRVLYEIFTCWNRSTSSEQPQGCARLNLPNIMTANGQMVFSIGGAESLEDTVCESGFLGGCNFDSLSGLGFSNNDAELLCDIWGCGIANLSNLEWTSNNALRPGTNDMCIFYSPSRAGFNAFDANRNAIIVDSCSTSDLF
jgi:hypothetical protein